MNSIILENIDLIKVFEKDEDLNYCLIEGIERHLFLFYDEELEELKGKIKKYGYVKLKFKEYDEYMEE